MASPFDDLPRLIKQEVRRVEAAGANHGRKRLMVNIDGLGQSTYTRPAAIVDDKGSSGLASSNVVRIGRATLPKDPQNDAEQIVYYQAGCASNDANDWISAARDTVWGARLVSDLKAAYEFICNIGDEIYLTGFGRGAFLARSLAGMIGKVGILTKNGSAKFYEAFEYYKYPEKFTAKNLPPPVSEADQTTRQFLPGSSEKIKIRAIGVWDTVGALTGDYGLHDSRIEDHVEHAFQILALNEKRGYFVPLLWESPEHPRPLSTLEQCWMAGDHCNVGGGWDDAQIADISLAWMMSRFDALGLKFDDSYLYQEYRKFTEWIQYHSLNLDGSTDKEGPPYPMDEGLLERTWGEGRTRAIWLGYTKWDSAFIKWGGEAVRNPTTYGRPALKAKGLAISGNSVDGSPDLLQGTNETFHPVIRYRRFCQNQKKLGAQDAQPYEPAGMADWTWPKAQKDGRIGADAGPAQPMGTWPDQHGGIPLATNADFFQPLSYQRQGKSGPVKVPESIMGKYEKMYLTFYDREISLQERDGSVWKKVLGGERPPNETLDLTAEAEGQPIPPSEQPVPPSDQPIPDQSKPSTDDQSNSGLGENFPIPDNMAIYIGKRPPVRPDAELMYAFEKAKGPGVVALVIQFGGWNGDAGIAKPMAKPAENTPVFFHCFEKVSPEAFPSRLIFAFDEAVGALTGFFCEYQQGKEVIGVLVDKTDNPAFHETGQGHEDFLRSKHQDVLQIETKAAEIAGSSQLAIVGIKLKYANGDIMTFPQGYEEIQNAEIVVEDTPGPEWRFHGFYGTYSSSLYRIGPVWFKKILEPPPDPRAPQLPPMGSDAAQLAKLPNDENIHIGFWQGWDGHARLAGDRAADKKIPYWYSSLNDSPAHSPLCKLQFGWDRYYKAITFFQSAHSDGKFVVTGEKQDSVFDELELLDDEYIVFVQTKAAPAEKSRKSRIDGICLKTNKGRYHVVPEYYDTLKDITVLSEEAPGPEWRLHGFYGAVLKLVYRMGPVWVKHDG